MRAAMPLLWELARLGLQVHLLGWPQPHPGRHPPAHPPVLVTPMRCRLAVRLLSRSLLICEAQ